MPEPINPREYVLRALAASEIAETTNRADLRESFNQLTETWLAKAAEAADGDSEA